MKRMNVSLVPMPHLPVHDLVGQWLHPAWLFEPQCLIKVKHLLNEENLKYTCSNLSHGKESLPLINLCFRR